MGTKEPTSGAHPSDVRSGSPDGAALRELARSETTEDARELPDELRHLPEKLKLQEIELRREESRQDIELRERYARWLLVMLAVELLVVNLIFWLYAEVGREWNIPGAVIEIWLGATVAQVVGVVTVVTRYLFPRRHSEVLLR